MTDRVIAVLGAGPGLGLSIARRFGAEGYTVALASRDATRHAGYRADLDGRGITSYTYPADLSVVTALPDLVSRIRAEVGPIETVYFGPTVAGQRGIVALPDADPDAIREPLEGLLMPAVAVVSAVLPDLVNRRGALLLPVGLSGLRPLPMLGNLAPASAAIRMYALTLHAQLAERGVFVGALTIGGLIDRGDIHRMVTGQAGGSTLPLLDPDEIAEAAWRMTVDRTRAEAVFDAMPG